MAKRRCVPGCKSNYGTVTEYSTFKFPTCQELKSRWVAAIHRENFSPSQYLVVCSRHFQPEDLIDNEMKYNENSVLQLSKINRPKLKRDAIPSIFPGQPVYMTSVPPKVRAGLTTWENTLQQLEENRVQSFLDEDKFKSFEEFALGYDRYVANQKEKCLSRTSRDNIFLGRIFSILMFQYFSLIQKCHFLPRRTISQVKKPAKFLIIIIFII